MFRSWVSVRSNVGRVHFVPCGSLKFSRMFSSANHSSSSSSSPPPPPSPTATTDSKMTDEEVLNKAAGVEAEEDTGERIDPVTGERNGPKGREPTRYGDWESKGRCWDF